MRTQERRRGLLLVCGGGFPFRLGLWFVCFFPVSLDSFDEFHPAWACASMGVSVSVCDSYMNECLTDEENVTFNSRPCSQSQDFSQ